MPYDEYQKWLAYFEQNPIGWRDDDRTMKLLQAQGVKARPDSIFPSLGKKIGQKPNLPNGMISVDNLKSSSLFHNMLGASGGVKLGVFDDQSKDN